MRHSQPPRFLWSVPVRAATLFALLCLGSPRDASAQSQFEGHHFTTSDSVRLHYLETGSGPTLVFVPGWTMPAWIWEPQIEHFASRYRVVALDPRGQGESEKPSHGYHASRRAADVCELLEHLGGEPAVVAGWSIAVQEVLVCSHEFGKEAIRAAVLVDHPVHFDFDPVAAFTDRFRSLQLDREAWTRAFVERMHASPRPDEFNRVLGEFLATLEAAPGTSGGLAYEVRGSGEPVLLIHGSYVEDALVPLMEEPALEGYRLIHYDRRSYGGSAPHDSAFSIEREAEDALFLLRELDVGSAHVVGFSYGGVIAFELARAAPEAVRSLVLIEPPLPVLDDEVQGPPPFLAEAVGLYQEGDTAGAVDAFMRGVGVGPVPIARSARNHGGGYGPPVADAAAPGSR